MSNVLRSLLIRVGVDLTDAQKNLKQIGKDLKSAGRDMQKTGATLTKSITLPVLGAVAGLGKMAIDAGKSADALITLSNKTGLTTTQLQELEYAARFVDVEVETMTDSMVKLTRNMDMARRGSAEQEEAFAKLGVEYKNIDGSLRNAKDVWADVIDALGSVASEADRDAIALSLFGRSAQELNPVIKAGSKELNRLAKEAHQVGAVIADDSVAALGKFDDQMQKMQAVVKGATSEIAVAMLPALQRLTPMIERTIVPAIKSLANSISDLISWFSKLSPSARSGITAIAAFAVGIGPALTVTGKITSALGSMASKFSAAAKAIEGGGGLTAALGKLVGPAGVAAIAVAAIALIAIEFNRVSKEAREATAEVRRTIDAISESESAFAETNKEIETNAILAKELAVRLFNLSREENLSNLEKEEMRMLVEKLNSLMPELNLQIDEQTNKLNMSRKAVLDYIDAKKQELLLQAGEEQMLEYLRNGVKLRIEQQEALDRLARAQDAVNRLPKVQFFSQGAKERYELIEAQKAVDLLSDALDDNRGKIKAAEDAYADLAKTVLEANKKMQMSTPVPNYNARIMPSGIQLQKYDVGTDYVPETGPAIIHKGEAVIPASDNAVIREQLAENNKLMSRLIGIVQSQDRAVINLDGKQVGEATLPWTLRAAARKNVTLTAR